METKAPIMHLVQLLLPLNDDKGRRFSAQAFRGLAQELTEKFGGVTSFTRTPAEGRWCLARMTPERLTWVPPPWNVGCITLVASAHGFVRGVVHHQRPVVGVADADVALAGGDVVRRLAVAAGRLLARLALMPFSHSSAFTGRIA